VAILFVLMLHISEFLLGLQVYDNDINQCLLSFGLFGLAYLSLSIGINFVRLFGRTYEKTKTLFISSFQLIFASSPR
jgi:hypothetical protein